MTIETKYNIGDEVWFMHHSGFPRCDRVAAIHIMSDLSILYYLEVNLSREENELFPTKEELLKSL